MREEEEEMEKEEEDEEEEREKMKRRGTRRMRRRGRRIEGRRSRGRRRRRRRCLQGSFRSILTLMLSPASALVNNGFVHRCFLDLETPRRFTDKGDQWYRWVLQVGCEGGLVWLR